VHVCMMFKRACECVLACVCHCQLNQTFILPISDLRLPQSHL